MTRIPGAMARRGTRRSAFSNNRGNECRTSIMLFAYGSDDSRRHSRRRTMSDTQRQDPPLMTVAEAARFLNVSARTIRALCASGQLPARKVGEQWRIEPQVLESSSVLQKARTEEEGSGDDW